MKQIVLLLTLLSFRVTAFSQQYSLNGKVVNQHNEPMEYVSAHLLKNDSVLIQSTTTDSTGHFSMNAGQGTYALVLEQFGTTFMRREMILDRDTDLQELMVSDSSELDVVRVTARKKIVEQKADRLVFHVENALSATGGTALDALKATPTVRVQNDRISIAGKGEVLVMIDDRLQRMPQEDLAGFLKSIPAETIKSIEVITTPPARYDAEGTNGLINIKLKTARANSWNATVGSSYTQKTYSGGNLQGLFNYNHKKISLQTSVNTGRQQLLTTTESHIFYPTETWKQNTRDRSANNVLSIGSGIDYKLTKRWTTGIHYLGSFTGRTAAGKSPTALLDRATETVQSYIVSDLAAFNRPELNSLNWYHSFALDSTGKNITVDFDHFNYRKSDRHSFSGNVLDHDEQLVPGSYFSSVNSNVNRIQNYSGKVDVSLPYKRAELSFGAKASYTTTNNDLAVYDNQAGAPVLNTDQSNVFSYEERNEALHFSASKKLNAKWSGQVGLRMEATQTAGYSKNLDQTNKNQYIRLFPTAYVAYELNENHSFSLNYSKRIRRPDFDYLNPFVIRTNPYDYSEGNPFLKPSYIHQSELSYINRQKWVSSVYFSYTSDFGQELSIIDAATHITRRTPLNYADIYQAGISTYYNFNRFSRWNSFTGFNLNYQQVKSKTGFVESIGGQNAYLYSNNDFTLNKSKSIFLGFNYGLQLPGRYQIFRISTMHLLDVSMKFLLADKKLSVSIICEDLLNGQRPLITYTSNGIKNDVRSYGDTRAIRMAVSYKFGNNQLKSGDRNSGNGEEQDRAN